MRVVVFCNIAIVFIENKTNDTKNKRWSFSVNQILVGYEKILSDENSNNKTLKIKSFKL